MALPKEGTANDTRLRALLAREAWLGTLLRMLLALAGLLLVRAAQQGALPSDAAWTIGLYLATAFLFAGALLAGRRLPRLRQHWSPELGRTALLGLSVVDLLYISLLVLHSGGPLSDAYLLYPLLMFKVALIYPTLPEIGSVAVLTGPAYLGVLSILAGGWFFLKDDLFLWRFLLLLVTALSGVTLGWVLAGSERRLQELDGRLSSSRGDVARQTLILQRTAGDLGRRVQQLRMLQEGVKAINSALALEDLLALIVANASQVVRDARCSVALLDPDEGVVVIRAVSDLPADQVQHGRYALGEGVVGWVVENGKPARIDQVAEDPRFREPGPWPVASTISVPLIADGQPIGALSATSPVPGAFTDEDLEVLNAFADQAVIAVKNARLYFSAQERRSELEAMLRGIGDAVVATDARLRLTVLNPIAAQIFAVRRGVSAGQRLAEVIDSPDLEALFAEALAGQEPSIIREIALPGNGADQGARILQALASPVRGEGGETLGAAVVLRDITHQKELDRVKSDFLSVVSHELKTPLHSIKGFVDIILMGKTGPVSDTQRDFLSTVRQQAEALQNMINDLLEFSRLEAGQIRLKIETVPVGQVVQSVVERMRPLAQEGSIRLANQVPARFVTIEADRARLEQVITNLLANACKFTPADGKVSVQARDLGAEVQISVSDTGIGIPADQLGRIFERFYQVDGTATRSYRGTGLGLTICKHIVEYHGGRIWVESEEGKGSTFHFVLPKSQPEPDSLAMDFTVLPPSRS